MNMTSHGTAEAVHGSRTRRACMDSQLCRHARLQERGVTLAVGADLVQTDGMPCLTMAGEVCQDLAYHAGKLEAVATARRAHDDLRRGNLMLYR